MQIPILQTKLQVPVTRSGFVARPRLLDQLHEGQHRRLTLISAPAGFGKTSLVAEWAAQRRSKSLISWVHLDEHDNEPVRFLTYIIAALQTHHRDIGEAALAGLQTVPPVPVEATLAVRMLLVGGALLGITCLAMLSIVLGSVFGTVSGYAITALSPAKAPEAQNKTI